MISLYLTLFTLRSGDVTRSLTIAHDSEDSFFVVLSWLPIIVALGACVAFFLVSKLRVRLNVIGGVVLGSSSLAFRNWLTHFDPAESIRPSIGDVDSLGLEASRGLGYYLLLLGAIVLLAGGALFIYLARKLPDDEPVSPNDPGQDQPYSQAGQSLHPGQTYGYIPPGPFAQQSPYPQQGPSTQRGQYAPYPDQAGQPPTQAEQQTEQPGQQYPGQQYPGQEPGQRFQPGARPQQDWQNPQR